MNKLTFAAIIAGAAFALSPAPVGALPPGSLGVRIEVRQQEPVIVEVMPGRTAAAIGFQAGDVLLEAGGRPISQQVLQEYWGQAQAGAQVTFKVRRGTAVIDLTGTAIAAPADAPGTSPPSQG